MNRYGTWKEQLDQLLPILESIRSEVITEHVFDFALVCSLSNSWPLFTSEITTVLDIVNRYTKQSIQVEVCTSLLTALTSQIDKKVSEDRFSEFGIYMFHAGIEWYRNIPPGELPYCATDNAILLAISSWEEKQNENIDQ